MSVFNLPTPPTNPQSKPNSKSATDKFGKGSIFHVDETKINPLDKKPVAKTNDSSMFGGKSELNRSEFRQKLRGSEGWKASEKSRLFMNPIERAKLEKEVFSRTYGLNISKSDIQRGEKMLNKKIFATEDPNEKNKIRKKIKFLKNLRGK